MLSFQSRAACKRATSPTCMLLGKSELRGSHVVTARSNHQVQERQHWSWGQLCLHPGCAAAPSISWPGNWYWK
jgi:hypothetical protein